MAFYSSQTIIIDSPPVNNQNVCTKRTIVYTPNTVVSIYSSVIINNIQNSTFKIT